MPEIGHNGGPALAPLDPKAAGWIRVNRDIREHPVVGFGRTVSPGDPDRDFCYSKGEAFLDLVMECRWCEGKVNNGGRVMTIQPGQLLGGVAWLAHRWNWTCKTVRVFLDKLQSEGMISRSSQSTDGSFVKPAKGNRWGNQANIITICKYEVYQVVSKPERQSEGQSDGNQAAIEGQSRGNSNNNYTKEPGNTEDPAGLPAEPAKQPAEPETREQLLAKLGWDESTITNIQRLADPKFVKAAEEAIEKDLKRQQREAQTKAENERRRKLADDAYSVYNKAATHFGFALCDTRTEKRTARLLKRIDEIGGLENFTIALRTIGRDDFLMGRKSKPGTPPFRLDFERLLSTDSGLGDVLARLLDLANRFDRPEDRASPNGKTWGWWRDVANIDILDAAYWRRRFDAVKPNGTWPWWDLGPPPGHSEALTDWDVVSGRALTEIYKGEIEHA